MKAEVEEKMLKSSKDELSTGGSMKPFFEKLCQAQK